MSAYATLPPATQILSTGGTKLTREEVLTAREVADLLKMPVSTV